MSPAQQSARERMLDTLRRRRPAAAAAMARKNRLVMISKALLPLAAVAILVGLVMAPSMKQGPEADRITYKIPSNVSQAASTIQGAQYRGVDDSGQPYTVTAVTAHQRTASQLTLSQPEGDITLNSGAWIDLKSDHGLFDQKTQTLGLNGNVTLYRNDGTTMTGPAAQIDLKNSSASSSSPVQAAGPFGTLNATGGFKMLNRGTDVVFLGPAKLILNQATPPSAQ